jgi:hypothetical protein
MVYSEADEPLKDNARPGAGIHHPEFGHYLKDKMDVLGIECVYRHTDDGNRLPPSVEMFEFFKRHLLAEGG